MVAARRTAMDPRAIATPTVAAPRTPQDKVRPTIAPMAPALHITMAEARLTRTPMAVKLRANTGKVRRIRIPMAVLLQRPTARARITPAPMATAQRIIHQPPTMAIIRPPRSTTTEQPAPTLMVGRLRPLSQPQLLLVRLLLQQMQTLRMLMQMLLPRQPMLTTPDTTPAQPRVAAQRLRPLIR